MSRPTQFCERCGEYVREETIYRGGKAVTVYRHIDADGNTIHRSHAARLADESKTQAFPRLP